MKTQLLKLTAFLLLFAGVFSACHKPDDPQEPDIIYPINVSFTDYYLDETSCQWVNLPYDEKVIVINSNEELENYLSCMEVSYPAIDFSTKSLLLISGKTTTTGFNNISKSIAQLSENRFKIEVEIEMAATDAEMWRIALITNKIKKENFVELNITYKESIYPIDIPFEEVLINCNWIIPYGTETMLVINSLEELKENATSCCNDNSYLQIDFSKYRLLIAVGNSPNQYKELIASVQHVSSKKCRLNVDVVQKSGTSPSSWSVMLLTQKIDKEIEYKINIIE